MKKWASFEEKRHIQFMPNKARFRLGVLGGHSRYVFLAVRSVKNV